VAAARDLIGQTPQGEQTDVPDQQGFEFKTRERPEGWKDPTEIYSNPYESPAEAYKKLYGELYPEEEKTKKAKIADAIANAVSIFVSKDPGTALQDTMRQAEAVRQARIQRKEARIATVAQAIGGMEEKAFDGNITADQLIRDQNFVADTIEWQHQNAERLKALDQRWAENQATSAWHRDQYAQALQQFYQIDIMSRTAAEAKVETLWESNLMSNAHLRYLIQSENIGEAKRNKLLTESLSKEANELWTRYSQEATNYAEGSIQSFNNAYAIAAYMETGTIPGASEEYVEFIKKQIERLTPWVATEHEIAALGDPTKDPRSDQYAGDQQYAKHGGSSFIPQILAKTGLLRQTGRGYHEQNPLIDDIHKFGPDGKWAGNPEALAKVRDVNDVTQDVSVPKGLTASIDRFEKKYDLYKLETEGERMEYRKGLFQTLASFTTGLGWGTNLDMKVSDKFSNPMARDIAGKMGLEHLPNSERAKLFNDLQETMTEISDDLFNSSIIGGDRNMGKVRSKYKTKLVQKLTVMYQGLRNSDGSYFFKKGELENYANYLMLGLQQGTMDTSKRLPE